MKVVFILSDALRHDYIKYMPFLKEMSDNHTYYENVIPGVGFCEISEYVTGLPSIENGNLFQLTFSGKYGEKKFKKLSGVNAFFNRIPRVRRYTQKAIDKFLVSKAKEFDDNDILRVRYNIPIDMINYFQPTESRHGYDSSEFFEDRNIFIQLKKLGKSYDIDDFVKHNKINGTDEDRLSRLNRKIKEGRLADFTLLYIGKGEIAHMTGTKDKAFHAKLTEYDGMLKHTKKLLDKVYGKDYRFIILGDHGMVDVKKYINVMPLIKLLKKKFGLEVGRNFVYFIDSTAFRIWVKDKKIIGKCDKVISEFLKHDVDDLKISAPQYGDLIYVLKPGCVFFPDFFNTKKNKGMHGYDNKIDEQKGLCVIIGTNEKKRMESLELQNAKSIVTDIITME